MVPAGIFHGDTVVIRRQVHAEPGQLVAAYYLYGYLDLPWLGLKYYQVAGTRVRLVAADPTVPPIDRDPGQVEVLGVLVKVDGTVTLPPTAPAGCVRHGRFLRPGVCGTCEPLAGALGGQPRCRSAGAVMAAWQDPCAYPCLQLPTASPVPVTRTDGAPVAHWAARLGRCRPKARASVMPESRGPERPGRWTVNSRPAWCWDTTPLLVKDPTSREHAGLSAARSVRPCPACPPIRVLR